MHESTSENIDSNFAKTLDFLNWKLNTKIDSG